MFNEIFQDFLLGLDFLFCFKLIGICIITLEVISPFSLLLNTTSFPLSSCLSHTCTRTHTWLLCTISSFRSSTVRNLLKRLSTQPVRERPSSQNHIHVTPLTPVFLHASLTLPHSPPTPSSTLYWAVPPPSLLLAASSSALNHIQSHVAGIIICLWWVSCKDSSWSHFLHLLCFLVKFRDQRLFWCLYRPINRSLNCSKCKIQPSIFIKQ